MRRQILPIILLIPTNLNAMEPWHVVRSPDGSVQARIPGPAEESFKETESLAGVMTTCNRMFQDDGVEFTISSTPLKPLVLRFVKPAKIFRDAKQTVLRKSVARETSFIETAVNGVPARLLQYQSLEQDGKSSARYHGVAIVFLHRQTLYIADAVVPKAAGEEPLKKFRDSIVIHRTPPRSTESDPQLPAELEHPAVPDSSASGGG